MQRMLLVFVWLAGVSASAGVMDRVTFKVSGTCAEAHDLWFHQLYDFAPIPLGQDAAGRPLKASVSLQLFPNHRYWLEYTESATAQALSATQSLDEVVYSKTVEGAWSADGATLQLPGVAEGSLISIGDGENSVDGVAFVFKKSFHNPLFNKQPVTTSYGFGNNGPKGISIHRYCRPKSI